MTTTDESKTALPVVAAKHGENIDYELLMSCVHCGLCLGSCPTYVETGNENDSPRGRIYLWRAVVDGRAELDDEVRNHLDLCLECRACETACPSGVQYGKIISSYKKESAQDVGPAPQVSALQRWMLFNLTPFAKRMKWALLPMKLLQWLRLDGVVRWMSGILPRSVQNIQAIVPKLRGAPSLPEVLPAIGKQRARVALLRGCAADAFFPHTTYATAKVLQHNGCEVWIPPKQACCGALHYHSGLVSEAQQFASDNCDAFADKLDQVDAIINNAGGCGPVMKEYDHILEGTSNANLGKRFAAKVRDISEFLADLNPIPPEHPIPIQATYHDACGLSHAQQIRSQPRELLTMIPELQLLPLPESEMCCGAAGSYNLTQPEMAHDVGERKANHIVSTGAKAVFTGNVGCLLQIGRHLRQSRPEMWVAHPIDVLWASYSGEFPKPLQSLLSSRGTP